jgi:metal-responsive CopG/Arc/MetJ family transcriptional regulator
MSSGPSIKDADRTRPKVVVTIDKKVVDALDEQVKRAMETRSAVVERALRKELGVSEPEEKS